MNCEKLTVKTNKNKLGVVRNDTDSFGMIKFCWSIRQLIFLLTRLRQIILFTLIPNLHKNT